MPRGNNTRAACAGSIVLVAEVKRHLGLEEIEALVLVAVDVQRRLFAGADHALDDPELGRRSLQSDLGKDQAVQGRR
jgi:glutamine amidotransferase PdxT